MVVHWTLLLSREKENGIKSRFVQSNYKKQSKKFYPLWDQIPAHSPEGQKVRETTLVKPTIGVSFAMKVATSKPFFIEASFYASPNYTQRRPEQT